MRGGVLLAEESPRKLIVKENAVSLEEAFLKLSMKQAQLETNKGEQDKEMIYPDGPSPDKTFNTNALFKKTRFMAQFLKQCRTTLRNLWVTAFVMLLPPVNSTLMILLFYNTDVQYPVGVLNEEGFNCHGPNKYESVRDCLPKTPLSCIFNSLLEEKVQVTYHKTMADGIKSIRSLHTTALLHFKPNFSMYIVERLESGGEATDEAADWGNIFVEMGHNDNMVSVEVKMKLLEVVQGLLYQICNFCEYPTKLSKFPVEITSAVYGKFFDYTSQMLPGYVTGLLFYTNFMFTSSYLVVEKNSGSMERDRISGLTVLEIMCAQISLQVVLMLLQDASLMIVLYGIFDRILLGSGTLLFITLFCCQFFGLCYGILISLIISKDALVSYAGIATVLTITLLNGTVWATEGMHWIIKPSGFAFAKALGADPIYNITLRGWGFTHYGVGTGIFLMILQAGLLCAFSYGLVKFRVVSF